MVHQYLSQITEIPATGPHGEAVAQPGKLDAGEVSAMTFDSGDLWMVERSRVDRLTRRLMLSWSSSLGTGFDGNGDAPGGIAVGHATGEALVYYGAGSDVAVLDPATGDPLGTWTGADTPAHEFGFYGVKDLAVDNTLGVPGEGDVYVADS